MKVDRRPPQGQANFDGANAFAASAPVTLQFRISAGTAR